MWPPSNRHQAMGSALPTMREDQWPDPETARLADCLAVVDKLQWAHHQLSRIQGLTPRERLAHYHRLADWGQYVAAVGSSLRDTLTAEIEDSRRRTEEARRKAEQDAEQATRAAAIREAERKQMELRVREQLQAEGLPDTSI